MVDGTPAGLAPSSSGQRLTALHQNAEFAAARDERGRQRFTTSRLEMQRLSNAARRGVDVPPGLEDLWKAFKRKRLANGEVAEMLALKIRRRKAQRKAKRSADRGVYSTPPTLILAW